MFLGLGLGVLPDAFGQPYRAWRPSTSRGSPPSKDRYPRGGPRSFPPCSETKVKQRWQQKSEPIYIKIYVLNIFQSLQTNDQIYDFSNLTLPFQPRIEYIPQQPNILHRDIRIFRNGVCFGDIFVDNNFWFFGSTLDVARFTV
ncbi:Hypothetical_protein [Hexamita inflata]|uniref:Hypothetical_protein n=1 Tax=Hexamita inflata TaxID=28002 RepID=A0AA86NL95_9EUKA|nr:Hypothetical protein HINF_LOCUS9579 [Hexamita inflata]